MPEPEKSSRLIHRQLEFKLAANRSGLAAHRCPLRVCRERRSGFQNISRRRRWPTDDKACLFPCELQHRRRCHYEQIGLIKGSAVHAIRDDKARIVSAWPPWHHPARYAEHLVFSLDGVG